MKCFRDCPSSLKRPTADDFCNLQGSSAFFVYERRFIHAHILSPYFSPRLFARRDIGSRRRFNDFHGSFVPRTRGCYLYGENTSQRKRAAVLCGGVPAEGDGSGGDRFRSAFGGAFLGNIILSVAVLAIIITAPLGALGIDLTYKKLLTRESKE